VPKLLDTLAARIVLYVQCGCSFNPEVFMTLPSLHITNGPAQRDLELSFIARHLGTSAKFTIVVINQEEIRPLVVWFKILNIEFVTCHGPNYKLGGQLLISSGDEKCLPPFNFIFVKYNTDERKGMMEFSNAE
jgi:hypothetical protein